MSTHGYFHWNELMTHDPERAKKFYADTVGWTFDPMPMGDATYWVAYYSNEAVAGIFDMKAPEMASMPEQWLSYLSCDDVDARFKKATAAGAHTMREPFDVAGVGRIAIVRDPGGAMIGLITPAEGR